MNLVPAIAERYGLGAPDSFVTTTHNSANDVSMNMDYVVKVYRQEKGDGSERESALCQSLQPELPTPDMVAKGWVEGVPFIVQHRLPGEPLELALPGLPVKQHTSMYTQMGTLLAKTHATPLDSVSEVLAIPEQDPRGELLAKADTILGTIASKQLLPRGQVELLHNYVADQATQITVATLGLRHGGYRPGNLLAQGADVSGIIDWEDASIGDTAEELALALYRTVPAEQRVAFMSGYNTVNATEHSSDPNLVYPLLYYLRFAPDIPTWTQFPGKQARYRHETAKIIGEVLNETDQLHHVA